MKLIHIMRVNCLMNAMVVAETDRLGLVVYSVCKYTLHSHSVNFVLLF